MQILRRKLALGLVAPLIMSLSGCGALVQPATGREQPAATSAPQIITIMAHDHHYEIPSPVPAGLVTFTLENKGEEPHHAQVARLKEGVTLAQVSAAAEQGILPVMELVNFVGGPSNADPGEQAQATANLPPGNYILICFIPSPDGIAHMAKGMITPFTVAAESAASATTPEADQTIDLYDFAYTMPDRVPAGSQVWKVVNRGPQVHELALFKLTPGKTVQDFLAFHQNPQGAPPYTHAGGIQFLDNQSEGWAHLDLEPGDYVANCFVPDPASQQPHMVMGMVRQFTVTGNE